MNAEIEMIHRMDESELDIAQVILLHRFLIKRGWAWKMPVSYQELARRYIDFDFLNDVQPERSRMKPKIQITTCHGFVTKVKSEGTEIEVEVVEEDTGKEARYTSHSCEDGDVLFSAQNESTFSFVPKH